MILSSAVLIFLVVWLLMPTSKIKIIKKTTTKRLNPELMALVLGITVFLFKPTILGAALAICLAFFAQQIFKKLPNLQELAQVRELQRDLDLSIDLIAAALSAGLTISQSLKSLTSSISGELAAAFNRVANRIEWGVPILEAFSSDKSSSSISAVGQALARASDHGVAAGRALTEIAHRTRLKHKQELVVRAKRLSVTLAIPVALLMLPGFILVGVLPLVAPAISALW
jgi:pilus assembly protein TadC